MERLLRFAVEHDRVIRLMFMRDGRLFQVNAHIVSYDDSPGPRSVSPTR